MAENIIQLTVNTDARRAAQPTTLNQLKATEVIRLIAGERPIIATTFVNKDNTAVAFGGSDTFEMNVDVDFIHDKYAGTLNASYTGAVSSIAITFGGDMTGLLRDKGTIALQDTSNPSNRESVAYTAIVVSGGSNNIVTFTVSKELTNSYASGDYGAAHDRLMAQATEDDVNTGEWASADKTAGLISFRLDCRDNEFSTKLAAKGSALEYQIYMEIKRYPAGSTIPIVLMQDTVYARQTVRDLEDVTIPSDENWTAADSRYLKKAGISGGQQAYGGTASGDDLTLNSTSNATKGSIILGSTSGVVFDEVNNRTGFGTGADENTYIIGGTTAGSTLSVGAEGTTDLAELAVHRHTATAGLGGHIVVARSRGTHATPTATADGDYLMRLDGLAHDGTDYGIAAQIDMCVDGTVSGTATPGCIKFLTSPSGSQTPALALEIGADKSAQFEGNILPQELITFSGTATAAADNSIKSSGAVLALYGGTGGVGLYDSAAENGYITVNPVTGCSLKYGLAQVIVRDGSISLNPSELDVDTIISGNTDTNLLHVDAGSDAVLVSAAAPLGAEKFLVSGATVLDGAVVINESGAAVDTRIEGDTDTNLIFVDASADNVGIGTGTPTSGWKLDVNGDVKCNRAYVCMYVSSAGATASITSGVPVNLFANATLASGITAVDFTVDDTGKQIDYTGTNSKEFIVNAAISVISSVGNQVLTFYVAKNGTYIAASRIDRKVGTASDEGAFALNWVLTLANTDTVEVFCDLASSGTITAEHAIVSITEL